MFTQDFLNDLTEHLKQIISHQFISNSQCQFVSDKIKIFKDNEILIQIDFFENYVFIAHRCSTSILL